MVAILLLSVSCKKTEVENTLSVSISEKSITSEAGSFTFEITSNIDWVVTGTEIWCETDVDYGDGNKTITVNYEENTGQERTCNLIISGDIFSKQITIKQAATNINVKADFTIEQKDLYGEASDKGYKVIFTQNCTDATGYEWSLYDFYATPSTVTGTDATFEHNFVAPGEYDVDLTASNGIFSDYVSKKIFVTGQSAKIDIGNENDLPAGFVASYCLYKNETDLNNYENAIKDYTILKGDVFYATNLIEGHKYYFRAYTYVNNEYYLRIDNFTATKNELTWASAYLVKQ